MMVLNFFFLFHRVLVEENALDERIQFSCVVLHMP